MIKNVDAMAADMTRDISANEKKRRIYRVESEQYKTEQLQADIGRAVNLITEERDRVDFKNADDVRQRITNYLRACQIGGMFPSVQGMAIYAFGVSKQALHAWRKNHPDMESSRIIELACDAFSDILMNESLKGHANPVQALFVLKNNHNFADRVEIQPITAELDEGHCDADTLRAKYLSEETENNDSDAG